MLKEINRYYVDEVNTSKSKSRQSVCSTNSTSNSMHPYNNNLSGTSLNEYPKQLNSNSNGKVSNKSTKILNFKLIFLSYN